MPDPGRARRNPAQAETASSDPESSVSAKESGINCPAATPAAKTPSGATRGCRTRWAHNSAAERVAENDTLFLDRALVRVLRLAGSLGLEPKALREEP